MANMVPAISTIDKTGKYFLKVYALMYGYPTPLFHNQTIIHEPLKSYHHPARHSSRNDGTLLPKATKIKVDRLMFCLSVREVFKNVAADRNSILGETRPVMEGECPNSSVKANSKVNMVLNDWIELDPTLPVGHVTGLDCGFTRRLGLTKGGW